jgi:hypothetical protein
MHKIGLLGSLSYAVADSQQCMPLQAIIVNTIFDLPVVENGASTEEMKVNFRTVNSWESWGNPHHGFHRETYNVPCSPICLTFWQ